MHAFTALSVTVLPPSLPGLSTARPPRWLTQPPKHSSLPASHMAFHLSTAPLQSAASKEWTSLHRWVLPEPLVCQGQCQTLDYCRCKAEAGKETEQRLESPLPGMPTPQVGRMEEGSLSKLTQTHCFHLLSLKIIRPLAKVSSQQGWGGPHC